MLERRWYFDPVVTTIFPNGSNGLHIMLLVKQAQWNAGHVGVLLPAHKHRGTAIRAEMMIKQRTEVRCSREMFRNSGDTDLSMRIKSRYAER